MGCCLGLVLMQPASLASHSMRFLPLLFARRNENETTRVGCEASKRMRWERARSRAEQKRGSKNGKEYFRLLFGQFFEPKPTSFSYILSAGACEAASRSRQADGKRDRVRERERDSVACCCRRCCRSWLLVVASGSSGDTRQRASRKFAAAFELDSGLESTRRRPSARNSHSSPLECSVSSIGNNIILLTL